MSFCIGLLLPANTPDAVLKTLASEYITEEDWYQLTEINEPHMTEGLEAERLFFVPHPEGGMDNSYTGIGSILFFICRSQRIWGCRCGANWNGEENFPRENGGTEKT